MRASFGSNLGFMLSAAGSAIGLGNIWKFPYITGINGGGVFVLFYLACVLLVALPILISEIAIGQAAQSNAVKSFDVLEKKPSKYKIAGVLGVVACVLISSFYGVVGGWIIYYLYECVTNFSGFINAESNDQLFSLMFSSAEISLGCQAIFMAIIITIVSMGVNQGIEKINKIAIPFLTIILFFLLYSVMEMPGFNQALNFLFWPHTNSFTVKGAMEAIGHSFFTISVGVGIMITYGSYLSRKASIAGTALVIVIADTVIALVSGIVIFTVIFSFESSPAQGPVLMFKTLPVLFAKMDNGMFIAFSFFFLFLLTAVTSAISLLEVPVAYLIDKNISRKAAITYVSILILLLGIPCGLSFGVLDDVKIFDKVLFNFLDSFTSSFMLPISGLICVIFFAYKLDNKKIIKDNFPNPILAQIFRFTVKYIAPACVVGIFLSGLII